MTKLAFLYTTFPRPTETFVRRELRGLLKLGLVPDLYSIWKGNKTWEGNEIHLFPLWEIAFLIIWIPYWAWKKPNAFKLILTHLWACPCPNLQNWNETFLGLASALVQSSRFKKRNYTQTHAVWATMPSTVALGTNLLAGIPFSMGAHAYDVFRNGGDWLLKIKLSRALFVRTSSESTAKRLLSLGVEQNKLKLVYRSLKEEHSWESFEWVSFSYLRLLTVGRLVEKKGYFFLLEILHELKRRRIPFEMQIVGGGPLKEEILREINRLRLNGYVTLFDHLDENQISKFYFDNDVFLFTGVIDSNGDRDGVPNVIPEAMSHGLLVLGSNQAGSSEGFETGVSGFSLNPKQKEDWVNLLDQIYKYPEMYMKIRKMAFTRANSKFSGKVNCKKLKDLFQLAACIS